ncbi:MAG: group II intron reverse transcriptase/maturase, partial [Acidobacteriota bacterium]
MHWFDALFHGPQGPARWADAQLVRYADDLVVLAKQMGAEVVAYIESRLVDLREEGASPNFLGYTFRYDRDLKGREGLIP